MSRDEHASVVEVHDAALAEDLDAGLVDGSNQRWTLRSVTANRAATSVIGTPSLSTSSTA